MRLIDADALIEDVRKSSVSYFADDFAKEWVDKQPTIEPMRKRGKWIKEEYCGKWRNIIFAPRICKCSECGNYLDFDGLNAGRGDANYCPNCGARMNGGEG